MALCGCPSWLVATAALALLLLPAQYYVPELAPEAAPAPARAPLAALDRALAHVPPADLCVTLALPLLALLAYLSEWIQMKLMEKRIFKLNQYLTASVERLRLLAARDERLQRKLRLVRGAAAEYGLLLHLLLRQHEVPFLSPTVEA